MKYDLWQRTFVIFVIALFVLIPVHVSKAMAADIVGVNVYGKNKVPGIRAGKDTMSFEVQASAPGVASLTNKVVILEEPTRMFTCRIVSNLTGLFNCTYEYPETETLAASLKFTLQIFDDAGNRISSPKSSSILVDSVPPDAGTSAFQLKTDDSGALVAQFTVTDIACYASACLGRCSGIKKVEFRHDGVVVGTYSNATSECTVSGTTPISITPTGTQEYSICMFATDGVGQTSDPACKSITLDRTTPVLDGAVEIISLTSGGVEGGVITSTKGQPIQIRSVKFTLIEDLGIEESYVDLINFDPRTEYASNYAGIRASCSGPINGKFTCYAYPSGAYLAITSPADLQVRIYAKDTSGNKLNTTVNYPVVFDMTPPVLQSLTSEMMDGTGKYWINESGFSIRANFDEAGSGLSQRKVLLDVNALGPQEVTSGSTSATSLRPNNCTESSNVWQCTWENLNAVTPVSGSQVVVTVTRAEDDAGNTMNTTGYGLFSVDKIPPEVLLINVTPIGETGITKVIGQGDILLITAYVQDSTPVTASGNFTKIIEMDNLNMTFDPSMLPFSMEPGLCEEFVPTTEADLVDLAQFSAQLQNSSGEKVYRCMWETQPVLKGYHADVPFTLSFTDMLGHVLTAQEKITIYARLNETEMEDYWQLITTEYETTYRDGYAVTHNSMVKPTEGLDRFIWPFASQAVYQEFKLEPLTGNPRIINIDFGPSRCFTGLEYVAHDDETGDFYLQILGYDQREDRRHDFILLMTEPSATPEVAYEQPGVAAQATPTFAGGPQQVVQNQTTNVNYINISCQMGITSIVTRGAIQAITTMQVKNFSIILPVYGNPLGQNLENIRDEIDSIQEDVESGWWSWMTTLRTIFEYMQSICSILGAVYNLVTTFMAIKDTFSGARATAEASVVGAGSASTLDQQGIVMGEGGLVADETLKEGLISQLYGVLCGLLVECRMTQGPVDNCGDDDTWCNFRQGWYKYNQLWTGWMDDIYLTDVGTRHLESGMRGLHVFNEDDFDPKRSIISSVFSGCIPGIIYNIEKQRQILCQKLICYKVEVAQGTPLFICDETYARNTCLHWIGQIFMAIPIFQYLEGMSQAIQQIIAEPWTLVGMALEVGLSLACTTPEQPPGICTVNTYIRYAMNIANSILTVVNVIKNWEYNGIDFCEEAVKEQPDISKVMP